VCDEEERSRYSDCASDERYQRRSTNAVEVLRVRSARGGVLAVFTRQNKPVLYLKIRATLKMRVSAAQAVGKDVKRGDFVGSSR
jgi:hypothetical protein